MQLKNIVLIFMIILRVYITVENCVDASQHKTEKKLKNTET